MAAAIIGPVPGFVYVDSELAQRISEAAEGEELSGAMLTQFVDMVEAYVHGLSGGLCVLLCGRRASW